MVQTSSVVALSDKTISIANIIAQRTGSLEIGIVKSLLIEQLEAKLESNQLCHILFEKRDGSLREMYATTFRPLIDKHIVGTGVSRERYGTTAVFCVESGAWRSFRWESLIKVF